MTSNQDYSLFHKFIDDFLPMGFNGIDSNNPLLFDVEQSTEINDQYFFVGDLLKGKILFTSKRSMDMIGVDPKELNPYHNIEVAHPDEVHRNIKGWAKLICIANNLLEAKSGCSLFSTNMKLLNPKGKYSETLFQCYLFYTEIPHKTVYILQIHTNIDWCRKIKHGYYYYAGNDMSHFKYPNVTLLNGGSNFTKREFEIIKLIESGMSTEQIADKLFLSPYTINTHRGNILKKSGKGQVSELIYELMEQGKL